MVFLENELMYGEAFTVDESVMGMDFVEPIGKARIMREGFIRIKSSWDLFFNRNSRHIS